MPGGDGTGPRGVGPQTGRMAGLCAGYDEPGYQNPTPGWRAGFGSGQGARRGLARRAGWGRGWSRLGYTRSAASPAPEPSAIDRGALAQRLVQIQEELSAIRKLIGEDESAKPEVQEE